VRRRTEWEIIAELAVVRMAGRATDLADGTRQAMRLVGRRVTTVSSSTADVRRSEGGNGSVFARGGMTSRRLRVSAGSHAFVGRAHLRPEVRDDVWLSGRPELLMESYGPTFWAFIADCCDGHAQNDCIEGGMFPSGCVERAADDRMGTLLEHIAEARGGRPTRESRAKMAAERNHAGGQNNDVGLVRPHTRDMKKRPASWIMDDPPPSCRYP